MRSVDRDGRRRTAAALVRAYNSGDGAAVDVLMPRYYEVAELNDLVRDLVALCIYVAEHRDALDARLSTLLEIL